jgi:hypothetical protein
MSRWIEVRDPRNDKLLYYYDPARDLVEIKPRGSDPVVIDHKRMKERAGEDAPVFLTSEQMCANMP